MDKQFYPTLYDECNCLFILGLTHLGKWACLSYGGRVGNHANAVILKQYPVDKCSINTKVKHNKPVNVT